MSVSRGTAAGSWVPGPGEDSFCVATDAIVSRTTRKAAGMPAACVHRVGSWSQVAPGPPRATKHRARGRRRDKQKAGSHVPGEVTAYDGVRFPPWKVRGQCSHEHSEGELGGQQRFTVVIVAGKGCHRTADSMTQEPRTRRRACLGGGCTPRSHSLPTRGPGKALLYRKHLNTPPGGVRL